MDYGQYQKLEFRRKFLRFIGASVDITNPEDESLVGYIEMKGWKLKEDIGIYSDRSMSTKLLQIHARSIIDFGATYDVNNAAGERLFSMRRKGLRSTFVRDKWELLNPSEQVFGYLQETSSGLALLRRYIGIIPIAGELAELALGFIAQTYQLQDLDGNIGANLTHRKNPFIVKFGLDRTAATADFDPRVSVAATALLAVVDANKD